jgi:hypothetical protein
VAVAVEPDLLADELALLVALALLALDIVVVTKETEAKAGAGAGAGIEIDFRIAVGDNFVIDWEDEQDGVF